MEALRNHLLRTTVRGGLHAAVLGGPATSTAAVSRITTQVEQVRQLLSGLMLSVSSVGFTFAAAVVGVLSLAPVVGLLMLPGLALTGWAVVRLSRIWRRRYDSSLAAEEALGEVAGGQQRRGEAGRGAFDDGEGLHRGDVFALIDEGDLGADVLDEGDQPFGLQPADRLAHRDGADAELAGDLAEHQPVSGREPVRHDPLAQPLVGQLRLAGGAPVGRCVSGHGSSLR